MSLESRIEQLEASVGRTKRASRHVHMVLVWDCRVNDEGHNEAAMQRALAANPAPKGAEVTFILLVEPKGCGTRDES